MPIPEAFLDLFYRPAFAHLATLMPDGGPQITPIWIDYDGQYVLINSAKGRVKNRNMAQHAQVALTIVDPDNPYRYLMIRGQVAEISEAGGAEHLDRLAMRYLGSPYPAEWRRPHKIRQIFKIAIEHIVAHMIASDAEYQTHQAAMAQAQYQRSEAR